MHKYLGDYPPQPVKKAVFKLSAGDVKLKEVAHSDNATGADIFAFEAAKARRTRACHFYNVGRTNAFSYFAHLTRKWNATSTDPPVKQHRQQAAARAKRKALLEAFLKQNPVKREKLDTL
jgi:hypothetical protein